MSYYLLQETMQPCAAEQLHAQTRSRYVAVLSSPEWERERALFDMGIELEPDAAQSRLRIELPKESASHLQRGDTVLLQLPAEALMPLTAAD